MLSTLVRRLTVACALLALLGLDPAGAARSLAARGPASVSLQPATAKGTRTTGPGYFVLHIQAGKARRLNALLANHSTGRATLEVAPVDAVPDASGNFSYGLAGARLRMVGAWIQLSRTTFKLKSGASARIAFTLQVPRQTRPGTYVGALTVFVPLPKHIVSRGATIQVQTRLADAIVVTVQRAARG
jgi:hypothetical protein